MKIGPPSGPILAGTKVHGPATVVCDAVFNYISDTAGRAASSAYFID